MTKQERQAESIAKALANAVRRFENFEGDPGMVVEELQREERLEESRAVRTTLAAVRKALL